MKNKQKILFILAISIFLFSPFLVVQAAGELPGNFTDNWSKNPNCSSHTLLCADGIQGQSLDTCKAMGCCSICDIMTVISKAFKILRNDIALPVAIIFGIIGGIIIIFSSGSPEKVKSGKKYITSALIGILIVFGASLIINTATIAIADSSYTFKNVLSGVISDVNGEGCLKQCTPGLDPKLKTITGLVVNESDLERTYRIFDQIKSKFAPEAVLTATTNGNHQIKGCHYLGRAGDLITRQTNKKVNESGDKTNLWPKIVNYLNNVVGKDPNFIKSGERLQAFCDKSGQVVSCDKADHIHFEIEPCESQYKY